MGSKTNEVVKLASRAKKPAVRHLSVGVRSYPQGIPEAEMPDDLIPCDAAIQILRRTINGQPAYGVVSRDGSTQQEVSPAEVFRAWYALGEKVQKVIDPSDPKIGWMYDVATATNGTIDHVQSRGELKRKSKIVGLDGKSLLVDG